MTELATHTVSPLNPKRPARTPLAARADAPTPAPSLRFAANAADPCAPTPGTPSLTPPVYAPPHWRDALALVEQHMQFTRRLMRAQVTLQLAGARFTHLHLIRLGTVKTVALSANGQEQLTGLHSPGDWIGFDSIATGVHGCDAHALELCEVWSLRHDQLLATAARVPAVMHMLCTAMSSQLARERAWRLSACTLPAQVRVAEFLLQWLQSLAARELRTDQITLKLTRGEIGSHLGMTVETVSRSITSLVRAGLVSFDDRGRRNFAIPNVAALMAHVSHSAETAARPVTLQ